MEYLFGKQTEMADKFTFDEIAELYPEAVKDGNEIVLSDLVQYLVAEISDLKDQMNEKDCQILYLMKKLDNES